MKKQVLSHLATKVATLYRKVCFVAVFMMIAGLAQAQFVHPGILSTLDELNVVKNNQTEEPWKSALDALKASSSGSLSYSMQGPYSEVYRGSNSNQGWTQHGKDATACYVQALLGYITGNSTYTNNAIGIINAWSNTLTLIGGNDVELLAGIQGPLWAQAGEILAHTGTGWASADITRAKNMLTNIFLPPMEGFASADGANFSTSCIFATMAIAVFTDNQSKFNEAWNAFTSTADCPNDFSLYKNIASNGQNVESGRDQVHSWSSYEMLSGVAEIAYHQGFNPYTLGSNRLKTGVEYWCNYNLGGTVPYDESVYRCRAGWGPWSEISDVNRGVPTTQSAVCNMVKRAYERLGQSTPYTSQMADAMGNTIVEATSRNGWGAPFIADALLHNTPPATYYQLQNRATGLLLDGMGRTTNGAACGQYANTTHVNSHWEMISMGSYYQFRNRGTGLLLDGMGRTSNGSDVGQWANTTHVNSQWTVQQYDGNYYRIQNRATGLYLDGMGRTANGANCGQWANTTHPNAQWQLIPVSAGARTGDSDEARSTLKEEASDDIMMYPNPVSDKIKILSSKDYSEGTEMTLHDNLGKLITSTKISGKEHVLDLSVVPQGIYVITLTNGTGSISRKVVKE